MKDKIIEILTKHEMYEVEMPDESDRLNEISLIADEIELLTEPARPNDDEISAKGVLVDVYGCRDIKDLKKCFICDDKSIAMIIEAMEQYAELSEPARPSGDIRQLEFMLDAMIGAYKNGGIININNEAVKVWDLCNEIIQHHTPTSNPNGKEFEIDFSGHCKARICINNNIPTVEAAVNGYGDAIDIIDINDISIYNQPTSTTKQNNTDNGNKRQDN